MKGKWSGKGKEYGPDGSLHYDGEFSEGKRNGKGTDYFYQRYGKEKFYKGEFFDGKRNGKGIICGDKEYIEVECKNGLKWNCKEFNS